VNLKKENWHETIDACTRALRLDEDNLKGYLRRARARTRLGDWGTAREDVQAALRVDPDSRDALQLQFELDRQSARASEQSEATLRKAFGSFWGAKGGGAAHAAGEGDALYKERLARKEEAAVVWMDLASGDEVFGRIFIRLLHKRAPRAAENFRQLCTGEAGASQHPGAEGALLHYAGCEMHRVEKGALVQGGDVQYRDGPDVGEGVVSVYGGAFKDEDTRGRHLHPGQVFSAVPGRDGNGSQFYITLDALPWLDGSSAQVGQVRGRPPAPLPLHACWEGERASERERAQASGRERERERGREGERERGREGERGAREGGRVGESERARERKSERERTSLSHNPRRAARLRRSAPPQVVRGMHVLRRLETVRVGADARPCARVRIAACGECTAEEARRAEVGEGAPRPDDPGPLDGSSLMAGGG
jgi:peptidylprolyl isomerase